MLAKRLIDGLSDVPHVVQNGDLDSRYPGCVNLSFAYVEGESLLMALKVLFHHPRLTGLIWCRMSLSHPARHVLLPLLSLRTYCELSVQTTIWHIHQ